MKVGTRLGLGFAWVVLLLVLVTGFGIFNMHQVQGRFTHVVEVKNPESALVKEMLETVGERSISLRNLMLPAAPEDVDIEAHTSRARPRKAGGRAEAATALCRLADTTEEEKAALPKIQAQAAPPRSSSTRPSIRQAPRGL
jgi:methyl-accepting chemotaxis protein